MKIGFLITARLKSTRLKLKLLKDLNGQSVIDRVIQRAKQVNVNGSVVLCTSKYEQDQPLTQIALDQDINYFCGDAVDVLKRLRDAAQLFGLDYFVGITGDNPLFSVNYSNDLVDLIRQDPSIDYGVVSGLPLGLNTYVLGTKALEVVCEYKEEVDTEIWGRLVNRPDIFNVQEVRANEKHEIQVDRITLDEQHDYDFIRQIYDSFPSDHLIEEEDIRRLLISKPQLKEINRQVKQLDLSAAKVDQIEQFFSKNRAWILRIKKRIYND